MELTEFKKQAGDETWLWKRKVPTPLGKFDLELTTLGSSDPPDAEMLRRAAELVRYAQKNADYILNIVFASYRAVEADPGCLKACGVPEHLKREGLARYLLSRSLVVYRDVELHLRTKRSKTHYRSTIWIKPLWDEEHGLSLDFKDGAVVAADGSPVKIKDGFLRWGRLKLKLNA